MVPPTKCSIRPFTYLFTGTYSESMHSQIQGSRGLHGNVNSLVLRKKKIATKAWKWLSFYVLALSLAPIATSDNQFSSNFVAFGVPSVCQQPEKIQHFRSKRLRSQSNQLVQVQCMARNDALSSGHTVINAKIINSPSYFIYATKKLILLIIVSGITQLQR